VDFVEPECIEPKPTAQKRSKATAPVVAVLLKFGAVLIGIGATADTGYQ